MSSKDDVSRRKQRRAALLIGASLTCGHLAGWAGWKIYSERLRPRRGPTDVASLATTSPVLLESLAPKLFSEDSSEAVWVKRILLVPPSGSMDVSYCCHLLRLYGLGVFRHDRFASGRDVLTALTDAKRSTKYFAEPIFIQTRSGIRYQEDRRNPTGENHRDLCLATFAELGLPLTTPMSSLEESFTLLELLRDSVENFDIKQRELPWTATAYALYRLPKEGWTNRYGERFDFNDLATKLVQTPLDEGSCGGAHLLNAVTVLLRVNAVASCLTTTIRDAVTESVRQKVRTVIESQTKEGCWNLDWYSGGNNPVGATHEARLLVTGHLLEFLEVLPLELQPPREVYRRAARWLCALIGTDAWRAELGGYCPPVHAVCSVRKLIDFGS